MHQKLILSVLVRLSAGRGFEANLFSFYLTRTISGGRSSDDHSVVVGLTTGVYQFIPRLTGRLTTYLSVLRCRVAPDVMTTEEGTVGMIRSLEGGGSRVRWDGEDVILFCPANCFG